MRQDSYRHDIDGLRAIAVLAVILFHIHKDLLPGGFVGVDVFFVLSGFLITGKILQDLAANAFSLRGFYVRRIKRIAPAMLVVVLVTVVAAQILLLPQDAVNAAKAGLWSLASLTNVYYTFFQDTGYFAQSSAELPLLHLWSLGVEEQFYLIWPVALALVYRVMRGFGLLALMAAMALVSFVIGELLFTRSPSFAYYMLPSRAGELLAGAMAALIIEQRLHLRVPAAVWRPLGYLGAAGLALALWLLREDQVFPGWRAMLPAFATAALLLAGQMDQGGVAGLLRFTPLRMVGWISYSAYLWHWPLLAFYRYAYGQPGLVSGSVIFVLTLALAWLTYATVEQPFRKVSGQRWRAIFGGYGLATLGAAAVALLVVFPGAVLNRVIDTGYAERLAKVRANEYPPTDFKYVCMRKALASSDAADPRCVLNAEGATLDAPTVLLWGDSNAAHYVGMVGAFARHAGFGFRNLEVGTCAPLLGPVDGIVDPSRLKDCAGSQPVIKEVLKRTDVVIIAAAWTFYQDRSPQFLERFFGTVRELTSQGKRVVLIGRVPLFEDFDRQCMAKALSFPWLGCEPLRIPMGAPIAAMNQTLRQFAEQQPGVSYFDATGYLCRDGLCSTHNAAGEQLYFDHGHLSVPGGWKLGEAIFAKEGVPAAFAVQRAVQASAQ